MPERAHAQKQSPSKTDPNSACCPVVGVGASAGGLEAFSELLQHLPEKTGLAFVFVQHLDPTHPSHLAEILGRATQRTVVEATDGMPVEPERVYVIPPNVAMRIAGATLHLAPRLTFAQDEKSAKSPGMPRSAVAAGWIVDNPKAARDDLECPISHGRDATAGAISAGEHEKVGLHGIGKFARSETSCRVDHFPLHGEIAIGQISDEGLEQLLFLRAGSGQIIACAELGASLRSRPH